jgi:hypothetical protein
MAAPCPPGSNIILQILSIVATFIVAMIALFKEWILITFFPPRPRIQMVVTEGQIGLTGQDMARTPAIYYHLQVQNIRRGTVALGSKITLIAFQTMSHTGTWVETLVPVPPFFYWAPMDPNATDGRTDIFDIRRFDFLMAKEGDNHVVVRVNRTFVNIDWQLKPNVQMRYILQVEGKNFRSRRQIVEVGWDGLWPDPDRNSVSIKTVSE